jgi:DNA-binding response OmpR family regulator
MAQVSASDLDPPPAPRPTPLATDPPVLDDDGLLRHAGRWVPISDTQIPLVAVLVRNMGRLVSSAEVRRAYTAAGGSGSPTSLRSVVHRLGRRVAEVGLRLHVVRGRGLVLDTGTSPRPSSDRGQR